LKSLKAYDFNAEFAENRAAARNIILEIIQKEATVGIGDSATVRQIARAQAGNPIYFYIDLNSRGDIIPRSHCK
jgi:hypothetical protein